MDPNSFKSGLAKAFNQGIFGEGKQIGSSGVRFAAQKPLHRNMMDEDDDDDDILGSMPGLGKFKGGFETEYSDPL